MLHCRIINLGHALRTGFIHPGDVFALMIFIRGRWIHLLSGLRTEVKTRDLWLNLLGTSNPLTEFTDIKHDFIIRECNFGLLFSVFRLIICQLCDYRVLCSMNK